MLKHNKILYKKVCREFFNNCLWYQVDGCYFEQKYFQEVLLPWTFNICEIDPTNRVASIVHAIVKSFLFERPDQRRGIYKPIRYILLPVLSKDHRAIERKKTEKINVSC